LAFFAFPDDFRIDQSQKIVAVFGDIDDHYPLVHIDMGGGQTHAGCGVHGFSHVANKRADTVVDDLDWLGTLVQARIGISKNRKQSHETWSRSSSKSRC